MGIFKRGKVYNQPAAGCNEKMACKVSRALEHGSLVHEEIERWIKTGEQRYTDNCTAAFFDFMAKNSLRPYLSEHIVFNQITKLATSIDAIVIDPSNTLIALEIKTGYDVKTYRDSSHKMKDEFMFMDDSVYNQHKLQLLTGTWLLGLSHPRIVIGSFFIVQICHDFTVVPHEVQKDDKTMTAIAHFFGRYSSVTTTKTQKK